MRNKGQPCLIPETVPTTVSVGRKEGCLLPHQSKAGRALSLQPGEYQWGPSLLGRVRFNQILRVGWSALWKPHMLTNPWVEDKISREIKISEN